MAKQVLRVGDVESNLMFFDKKGIELVDTIMGVFAFQNINLLKQLEKQFQQQYPQYGRFGFDNLINYMLKGTYKRYEE